MPCDQGETQSPILGNFLRDIYTLFYERQNFHPNQLQNTIKFHSLTSEINKSDYEKCKSSSKPFSFPSMSGTEIPCEKKTAKYR